MSKGTVNKVILIGRLGKDPDLRYSATGTAIASFSLATNHGVKSGDTWETKTEWHKVVAFNKTAEMVAEYAKKGTSVYVEGRLQTSNWEDENGQKKYKTEVVANEIQLLGSKESTITEKPAEVKPAETPDFGPDKDDLPF